MVDRCDLNAWIAQQPDDTIPIQDILDYLNLIQERQRVIMTKKKSKTKNFPPNNERCNAYIRGNDKPRCSRHRKNGHLFCGTHVNHQPYGSISETETLEVTNPGITDGTTDVWPREFHGIMYFIDKHHNVYNTADVLRQRQEGATKNAEIIGVLINDSLQLF